MDSFLFIIRPVRLFSYLVFFAIALSATRFCLAAEPADIVILNANVRTMNGRKPRTEAIAIKGRKFVGVGTNDEIRRFIGPLTKEIDAGGRLMLPGFNDAHVHFAAIGNKFSSIDVRGETNPEAVAEKIAEYARFLPKGRWILGSGFGREFIAADGGRLLGLVDPVTRENPVLIYLSDGRMAFANSLAIARATAQHLSARTVTPTDGFVSGQMLRLVAAAVPADHIRNWPEILETASNYAASFGVTSVQDMQSDELDDVYRQLDREGKLKTRVYDCSPLSSLKRLVAERVKAASGTAMVRTGCVKYFSEGDATELAQLRRDIAAADQAGLQVMIHAIGQRANHIVLDAFEWAAKENGPRDRRFRVEHAHNALPDDVPRFARNAIIPSMQPWLFRSSGPAIFSRHLKLHSPLAFGSDAPMLELDPLLGIYAAVSGPEGISVDEAVRAYTVGSAFAEFQEKVKGTIDVGKLADLVVLSDNIFVLDPSRIRDVRALLTIVNGRIVFERVADPRP